MPDFCQIKTNQNHSQAIRIPLGELASDDDALVKAYHCIVAKNSDTHQLNDPEICAPYAQALVKLWDMIDKEKNARFGLANFRQLMTAGESYEFCDGVRVLRVDEHNAIDEYGERLLIDSLTKTFVRYIRYKQDSSCAKPFKSN